jgi:hypothetical protein
MTQSRITQAAAEVGSTLANERVTQTVAEVGFSAGAGERVSQVVAEVGSGGSKERVTQAYVELGFSARPLERVTQAVAEIGMPYAVELDALGSAQVWPRGGDAVPGGDVNATRIQGRPVLATAPTLGQGLGWNGSAWGPNSPAADATAIRGIPVSVTAPTNGQALLYDSGSGLYVPSAATPPSKYQVWDPFIPDVTPHSLNEEFTTTSLAGFIQIYTGDAGVTIDANTTAPGWLHMELPHQQWRMRALMKALPGDTNFTIHSCVALGYTVGDGSYPGLVLSNNANSVTPAGNQHVVAFSGVSNIGSRVSLVWDGYGNTASGASAVFNLHGGYMGLAFLRWRRQAGQYYMGWALDPFGLVWHERAVSIYAGMTPTHFGLAAQNYTGITGRVAFGYLRYYATGTQFLTGGLRTMFG